MANMVREKVESGAYATESEVVREGLRALEERDAAVERWLREEVAPAYDAHKAGTLGSSPLAEAFDRLEAHMSRADPKAG
jgi:putative addiction module CopG family antidote